MPDAGPMDRDGVLRTKLRGLQEEHRDLDAAIAAMQGATVPDTLAIARLKKRKLRLKDQIVRLEDELTPDIIA